MNRKVIFAALIAFLVIVVVAWLFASCPGDNEIASSETKRNHDPERHS